MTLPSGERRTGRSRTAAWLFVVVAAAAGATVTSGSTDSLLPAGLVYLRDVDASIVQDIRYAGRDNFTGAPLPGYDAAECILTRAAALALKQAQAELAAAKLALKVYDCYRPARATRAMVRWAREGGRENTRFYPRLDKAVLLAGYIAAHSRHATGTAVDLTLINPAGPQPAAFDPRVAYGPCIGEAGRRAPDSGLDMGTGYDCFDPSSHTNSAAVAGEQRRRRMLLVATLARHGFRNYHREWWHFTFGASGGAAAHDFSIAPRGAR